MSFTNAKIVSVATNPEAYFADIAAHKPGQHEYPISSSALREFAHCPARWRAGYESPESDTKDWGALVDCLALTPSQFPDRYAVRPDTYEHTDGKKGTIEKPWNGNATACKDWIREQGARSIVKHGDYSAAQKAVWVMVQDATIAAWTECSQAQVWVAGEWHDDATGLIVPVRCLIDYVPRRGSEFERCLGDLKTCRTAAILPWQRDCYRCGYHIQAAWNTDLYIAATGEDRNTWCWILSESYPPYQTAKRMLSQDFLTLGRAFYTRAMEQYCVCLKANRWPGYDDTDEAIQGWTLVQPEPWMAGADAFSPKITIQEDETLQNDDIIP